MRKPLTILLLVTLLGAVMTAVTFCRGGSFDRIDERIDAARARGEPGLVSDLVRPDENPTPGVEHLLAWHEELSNGAELFPDEADPLVRETFDVEVAAQVVGAHEETLGALANALSEDPALFPIVPTQGGGTDSPHVFPVVEAAKWLHARAEVRAVDDPAERFRFAQHMLNLSARLPDRSTLELLVAVSVRQRGMQALRDALRAGDAPTAEQRASLDAALDRPVLPRIDAALAGERALALELLLGVHGDPRAWTMKVNPNQTHGGLTGIAMRRDIADYVDALDDLRELLATDPRAALDEMRRREDAAGGLSKYLRPLSTVLMPASAHSFEELVRSDAGANLLRGALELQATDETTGPSMSAGSALDLPHPLSEHPPQLDTEADGSRLLRYPIDPDALSDPDSDDADRPVRLPAR